MGLFTTDPDIGADVADLFNFLTGFARPRGFRKLMVAPMALRETMVAEVRKTIEAHRPDCPSRIEMKMNALVDAPMILALYEASKAGVRVDLNIRGICCLRPGVEGLSENIRVVSTLGRFLEHSRVYRFEREGSDHIFIGSADLMPRNLDFRVEVLTPVEDPGLRAEIRDALTRGFTDQSAAWDLESDGTWNRIEPAPGTSPRNAQLELMKRAAAKRGDIPRG
jgi:polyphosphate kinase